LKSKETAKISDSEIIIYQTQDGSTKIDVRMENETVWLTQAQMAELFQTTKQNVSLHISNAIEEGEVDAFSVVKEYLTTAADGKNYSTKHYNLDAEGWFQCKHLEKIWICPARRARPKRPGS
jgi:hypothetical protein